MNIKFHRLPIRTVFDHHGYPAINKCIYCGVAERSLTKEHIIGKAINGRITLHKSSCRRCAEITRDIEQQVFNGHMRFFRLKHNFKSSHPKGEPVLIPVGMQGNSKKFLKVPRERLPGAIYIPKSPPPKLVFGEWPSPNSVSLKSIFSDLHLLKNVVISHGPINAQNYARMLAKIAHAYACAEVGLNNFDPYLQHLITDFREGSSDAFQFVGCIDGSEAEDPPKENCLHRLQMECWDVDGTMHLVVVIRLFAYIGAPVHHVLVGSVSKIPNAALTKAFRSKTIL